MSFSETDILVLTDLLVKSKKLINDAIEDDKKSTTSKTHKHTLTSLKSLNEQALKVIDDSSTNLNDKSILETLSLGSFDAILTEIDNESNDGNVLVKNNENNNQESLLANFFKLPQNVQQFVLTPV